MSETALRFVKLEALDNDFMLIDLRDAPAVQVPTSIQRLAHRRRGVGFDQMLVLRPGDAPAIARVEVFNADGSRAEQCGNGMRAIAAWLDQQHALDAPVELTTDAGPVQLSRAAGGRYRAALPAPRATTAEALGLPQPELDQTHTDWHLISLGNPHLIVRTQAPLDAAALAELVRSLDRQARWSRSVNIGLMHKNSDAVVELRVHERGAGPTPACGSGACAAAFAARVPGLDRPVEVRQPGGTLMVDLNAESGQVVTVGPARVVYEGQIA